MYYKFNLTIFNSLIAATISVYDYWPPPRSSVHLGVTIPRKRPKKTRNPEKDPKKTLFSTKFCLYVTIILFYILVCVPNMYLQVYFM